MNKKRFVLLLDGTLLILAAAAVPVTQWMFRNLPDCAAAEIGLPCPSCGGTRCVQAFFSGDFAAAYSFNPFFFVLIWYLGTALALLNVGVLLEIKWAEKAARIMTGWQAVVIAAVAFAIFGLTRNMI